MLCAMGAQISGIGTNLLRIDGVPRLHGATARIGADYIDAGSYITAALVTGGELDVTGIRARDFAILEKQFAKFGVKWTLDGHVLHLPGGQELATQYDLGEAIPKIEDGIWPAFPSDLMSILIVLATQTRGTTLFFEKMFESRLYFVDHLISMGAHIVLCDPHRVVVTGSTQLHGGRVTSPDIRAGIALLIAALAAHGESHVLNAESIDRGYESVEERLGELGADIRRE
jgi:UDP-N-acetylglucosamine 1-carboxyvinyltransferase